MIYQHLKNTREEIIQKGNLIGYTIFLHYVTLFELPRK